VLLRTAYALRWRAMASSDGRLEIMPRFLTPSQAGMRALLPQKKSAQELWCWLQRRTL